MARPVDPEKGKAILLAAKKIFVRDGYQAAKISAIATEAGVAAGTVYLYFESKEAIATALASDFFARAAALMAKFVPHFADEQGIETYLDEIVIFASAEKAMLAQIRPDPGVAKDECSKEVRNQLLNAMAKMLSDLMDQGKIRKYDPVALANLIFGMLHSVVMGSVVFDDVPLADSKRTTTLVLKRALFVDD